MKIQFSQVTLGQTQIHPTIRYYLHRTSRFPAAMDSYYARAAIVHLSLIVAHALDRETRFTPVLSRASRILHLTGRAKVARASQELDLFHGRPAVWARLTHHLAMQDALIQSTLTV